jgi:hypothetical protein
MCAVVFHVLNRDFQAQQRAPVCMCSSMPVSRTDSELESHGTSSRVPVRVLFPRLGVLSRRRRTRVQVGMGLRPMSERAGLERKARPLGASGSCAGMTPSQGSRAGVISESPHHDHHGDSEDPSRRPPLQSGIGHDWDEGRHYAAMPQLQPHCIVHGHGAAPALRQTEQIGNLLYYSPVVTFKPP